MPSAAMMSKRGAVLRHLGREAAENGMFLAILGQSRDPAG